MGGRYSLPTPGERSSSDSLGPPSLLWSPWLELGVAIVKYQYSKLSIKSELISKFFHPTSCNKPSYCSIPLRTTSLLFFPFSPINFLNSIPPEWVFSRKYLSNPSSIHWVLLKDCLGLFGLVVIYWATCSDPTFLGDHDCI